MQQTPKDPKPKLKKLGSKRRIQDTLAPIQEEFQVRLERKGKLFFKGELFIQIFLKGASINHVDSEGGRGAHWAKMS